jgi:hypothetical protein
MVPRREWDAAFRRDGYRCMTPGCTVRADMHGHHIRHRAHLGPDEPSNLLGLCWLHHQEGVHGDLARVRGTAPLGLVWRLGKEALASWYRNERRLDRK